MADFLALIKKVLPGQRGATLFEYGLLIGLIAIACIAVLTALGHRIIPLFKVPAL
jgi:Flp pilus assembly pilin Flp